MTTSRDEILSRLRKATPPVENVELPAISDEELFGDYPASGTSLIDLFAERLAALKGEVFRVPDAEGEPKSTFLRTCWNTVSDTQMPPGSASCSRRAATLTPSP